MAEHRGVRPGIARVGQMSHAAAVRSPRKCGVSKTETGNEDCRLDQKGKHRIRPVIALAIFSLPGGDNFMNLNAENLATCGKLLCSEAAAETVSASSRAPSCAIRLSRKTPNRALWKNPAQQIDPCDRGPLKVCQLLPRIWMVWRRDFNNAVDRRGGTPGSLSTPSQMRKNTNQSAPGPLLAIPRRPFAPPAARQPGNPAGVNVVSKFPALLA
jgi:hypothetical protein